jgi:hypothetical protein
MPKLVLDDDDFLRLVADERRRSIGFDHDDELAAAREKALNYVKGEMPDVPALPNRSKAVSTDVADAIETALPDLVEIFVGGDDVAAFQPTGPDDEDRAQAETDYVNAVIFDQNPGFLLFYSIIKDALTCKIGVSKSWWEETSEVVETRHEGLAPEAWPAVRALAEAQGGEVSEVREGEGGVAFTLRRTVTEGRQRNMAVPPEDFTFAADTVSLREATYCAMRSRPRAQSLLDQGYDAALVDELPEYSGVDDALDLARDSAGESEGRMAGCDRALRTVEIVEHYIRLDADGDGRTELWRVTTGGGDTVLLEKEQVSLIPFAAITPYIVTHRLLGHSLADLLLEVQRIKTALLRMLLDSGYFALNQRLEVATDRANQWTISDLLRNEPGAPIRSKTGDAVRPVTGGGLNFDVTGALEYISVVAEGRTGIVRNAQGLNPDTLHDTADGARRLIAAAQKRVRMIARVFAETGIKDLFLIVHELLRTNAGPTTAQLRGQWARIDPSAWPSRKGLRVEIGVGSGGREHDLAAGSQLLALIAQAVQAQGGMNGPLVKPENLYAAVKRQTKRLGFKNPELYWSDPRGWQAPAAAPHPEAVKAQVKGQVDAARLSQEAQLKRERMALEIGLKRDQIAAEIRLRETQIAAEAGLRGGGMGPGAAQAVQVGGEPG